MNNNVMRMSSPNGAILVGAFIFACGVSPSLASASAAVLQTQAAPAANPAVNEQAQILAEFKKRVDAYVNLHRKMEASLPKLSKEATPEAIDRHQRELGTIMASARASAAQGDIFTPQVQAVIKKVIQDVFARRDHRKLRESIMDENPRNVRVTVNGRYPDTVPIANMPADILRNLPELPEEVEYRFVSETLILLDPKAHIVADFVPGALPR